MADAPPAWPDIPGYVILERLGQGGMGTVYRARGDGSARDVAIKVLAPGQPLSGLRRESELMGRLIHPHVVAIHACGQTDGRDYLAMEFVPGGSLRTRMQPGRPWPVARAVSLVRAVGDALAYIHSRGILHLDLKPENVLCGADGAPKITDFGLAQTQPDADTLATLGTARGTLDYCAPEQRYGLPVDPRTDLFALATLAYELLAGRVPGRVYGPAQQANASVPAALDAVLRAALARDRDERPASVHAFLRDVTEALTDVFDCPQRGTTLPCASVIDLGFEFDL